MKTYVRTWCSALLLAVGSPLWTSPLCAQGEETESAQPANAAASRDAEKPAVPRVKLSDPARAALAAAKELAAKTKGLQGNDRAAALQLAAAAYDKVAADFATEPAAGAQAAFAASDLWRAHGSLALAEKDFLLAARLDPQRFGQRGLMGAAEMQRRLKQPDKALATYVEAVKLDPDSSRAQDARLWQGRLLQQLGRLDEAVSAFQAALETAEKPGPMIDASNWLAKALLAKGDLAAAERAIAHAEQAIGASDDQDPVAMERLQKALDSMSAKKALQRAKDKAAGAGKDAVDVEKGSGGEEE